MNIFDARPELNAYVAKYMDENGCDFQSACEALGINQDEDVDQEFH